MVLDTFRLSCGLGNDDLLAGSRAADDLQMTDGAKRSVLKSVGKSAAMMSVRGFVPNWFKGIRVISEGALNNLLFKSCRCRLCVCVL